MSTLQFPTNPMIGDTYDWDVYKYIWDGEKWKTIGIWYNPVNDLRDELAAPGGAGLVGFQQSGTGAVARTAESKLRESVSVEDFGAIADGVTNNTPMIQAAIDAIHNAGGGVVYLGEGIYTVGITAATDLVANYIVGDAVNMTPINVVGGGSCLVVRPGVTLQGAGMGVTTIKSNNPNVSVIAMLNMRNAGLRDMSITGGWVGTGAGHGVWSTTTTEPPAMTRYENYVFENLEIHHVGSYGFGNTINDHHNGVFDNIWLHDTGADGIDFKVHGGPTSTCVGVTLDNIFSERFGLRLADSAGLDIRGPLQVSNYTARDFGRAGTKLAGIRFSAGTAGGGNIRQPSQRATLVNFNIEANPGFGASGIVAMDTSAKIVNGTLKNCNLDSFDSTSGFGDATGQLIANVCVEGSRSLPSFKIGVEGVTLIGCFSDGDSATFSDIQGNLVAGQTVFAVPQGYDPSVVRVYKNGVLLTATTDYTATTSPTVTLTTGVLITDIIRITTPTDIAYDINKANCSVIGCGSRDAISEISLDGISASKTMMSGNPSHSAATITQVNGAIPYFESIGSAANIDMELRAKGASSGITLRCGGSRAFRATAPSGGVNWVSATGSATGVHCSIAPAGSDADIDMSIIPKGNGTSSLTDQSGRRKVLASVVGVGFHGTTPVAKPTVTGSRGGNAALASLLTALAAYGLITDGTSA